VALGRIFGWKDTSFDPAMHGQVFGPDIEEAGAAFERKVLAVAFREFEALDAVNGKYNWHFHGPFSSASSVYTFDFLSKPIFGLRGEHALGVLCFALRGEHVLSAFCFGSGFYIELGFPEIDLF